MKKSTFKLLIIAMMLCISLLNSVAQTIPIGSVEDLRGIGIDTDKPMNGIYELTNDIDLSGVTDWAPIGMSAGHTFNTTGKQISNFTGTFDGKGFAIENLNYTYSGNYTGTTASFGTDELTGGIFGRITGQVINLNLKNLTITGNCASALAAALASNADVENVSVIGCTLTGGGEVGGIAGRTNNNVAVTIKNCFVDETTNITGATKVGGLVGNIGQATPLAITNCYVAAGMKCTDAGTIYGLVGNSDNANGIATLKAVFVMAQAVAETTLEPFGPSGKIVSSTDSYACSDYFPSFGNTKTLSELQDETTYTAEGWDFDAIWQIKAGEFPTFQQQAYPASINIGTFSNGSVSADYASAPAGETITLTVSPATGYELASISAYKTDDETTIVELNGTGLTRTFTMPAYDVTVAATFQKTQATLDAEAVAAAKTAIEEGSYTVKQTVANTEEKVKTWLVTEINDLISETGVTVSETDITLNNFIAAVSATSDGSFDFTVSLSKGSASDIASMNGTITAEIIDGIGAAKTEPLWKIHSANSSIEITVSEPLFLSVCDMAGKTLFAAQVDNCVSIPAKSGIYILKGKDTVQKIIVK